MHAFTGNTFTAHFLKTMLEKPAKSLPVWAGEKLWWALLPLLLDWPCSSSPLIHYLAVLKCRSEWQHATPPWVSRFTTHDSSLTKLTTFMHDVLCVCVCGGDVFMHCAKYRYRRKRGNTKPMGLEEKTGTNSAHWLAGKSKRPPPLILHWPIYLSLLHSNSPHHLWKPTPPWPFFRPIHSYQTLKNRPLHTGPLTH